MGAEVEIPDELIELGAKAAAVADGWDWGDGESASGRSMEYDFPHPRAMRTEYGAITKPVYRRRANAALHSTAALIVAAELQRLADDLQAEENSHVIWRAISRRARELRGED
jgi:hypothetical protein